MSNTELPALGKAARSALHTREPRHTRSVPTKFFTMEQIADCLGVSPRTVRRWIDDELLVAHRIKGVVRISEADFAAFLAARRGV